MRKITHEALGAEVLLPDHITGVDWVAFQQAMRDNEDADPLTRAFRAAMSIAVGTITRGETVIAIDENAPLPVLVWLKDEVFAAIMAAQSVPKN